MLGGLGVALWIAEAALASQTLSFGLSNALLFAACGTIWNGARVFYARKVRPVALSIGAVWMAIAFPLLMLVFLIIFFVLAIWLLPKIWRGLKRVLSSIRQLIGHPA